MSSYSAEQIGILVRKRLGMPPAAVLDYVPLIPAAILRTIKKAAQRNDLRPYTLTDPATVTVTLDVNGVADLSALITSPHILLDCLKYGDITHPDYDYPLRLLGGSEHGLFAGSTDNLFAKCWVEGDVLKTRPVLTGALGFAVPYWQTLAQIDDALVEIEGIGVVDSVIDLLSLRPDEEDGAE